MDQALIPQARLQTRTTSTFILGSEDSQSKGHRSLENLAWSVLCETRTRGGGWCRMRRAGFLCVQRTEMTYHFRRRRSWVSAMKGKPVLSSVFRSHICWPNTCSGTTQQYSTHNNLLPLYIVHSAISSIRRYQVSRTSYHSYSSSTGICYRIWYQVLVFTDIPRVKTKSGEILKQGPPVLCWQAVAFQALYDGNSLCTTLYVV